MKFCQQDQKGVTLLEVLLVMAIALTIIYLSLQQYLSFKRDADVRQVESNVDLIFTAMAKYFQANCRSSPFNQNSVLSIVAVDLNTLMTQGYMSVPGNQMPLNPLINPTQSYIAQFNVYHTSGGYLPQRTVQYCPLANIRPDGTCNAAFNTANIGAQTLWQIQVAARLQNPATARQYLSILRGDCLSQLTSGWGQVIVGPCGNGFAQSDYVVFTRSPSFSNSRESSDYWLSMPVVKRFAQMYTTDPILVLTNPTTAQVNAQYYVCGNSPGNFCGGSVICP